MIIRKYGWDTKSHAIIARLEGVIYPDSVIGYYILDADHLAALAEKDMEHGNQLIQLEKIANEVLNGYKDKVVMLKAEKEKLQKAYFDRGQEILDLETAVKVFQDDTAMRKTHIEHLEKQIAFLQEREKVLIGRLRSYGDVETYREEALRGKKEGLPDRA